jgi:hypothetical protein
MRLFSWLKGRFSNIEGKGAAFTRHLAAESAVVEAKSKAAVLRGLHSAVSAGLDEAESLARELHLAQDAIDARIAKLNSVL